MNCCIILATLVSCILITQAANTNEPVKMPYAKSITLNCTQQTAPVTWYFVNKTYTQQLSTAGKFIVNGNSLSITDLRSNELTAEYVCSSTSGNTTFSPKPDPYMFNQDKSSVTITEGGYVTFTCKLIVGYQQGQTVKWDWQANGKSLSNDTRTQITVAADNSEAKLVLRQITVNDKGDYTCSADNGNGNYTQSVQLRVKNTLAALWPFLAIVGEVAILCTIILIFEKKCGKKNSTNETGEQSEKLVSPKEGGNNSDVKKRTAKA